MQNGASTIPTLGLGTYGRLGPEGVALVRAAVELGYRHLDTAQSYETEVTVREAIREAGAPAGSLFITTKVASVHLARDKFLPSVEESRRRLGVDCIDLLLVHWPSAGDAVPFEHYVTDLAEARRRGWTTLAGVSNFPIALLEKARRLIGDDVIVNNQVEVHPYLQNRKLRDWCRARGIAVTAYMPLAKGKVASDPAIQAIAARCGATPAQVVLAFLLGEGLIVIPSSTSVENMKANLAATRLTLSPDDVATLRGLDRGERMINPPIPPAWD